MEKYTDIYRPHVPALMVSASVYYCSLYIIFSAYITWYHKCSKCGVQVVLVKCGIGKVECSTGLILIGVVYPLFIFCLC